MRIGIPKEIKPLEGRVPLVPAAVADLVDMGLEVFIQSGAGQASGYTDSDYTAIGAGVLPDAGSVYSDSELILKVKEPVAPEYELLKPEHILFSYLHLAAAPELAAVLQARGLTAVAFETVEDRGHLPLLAPMSEIAGILATQLGVTYLHSPQGGRGILLGGLPGTERGRVTVLGAGSAGGNAARVAAALGAEVTVFARSRASHARMHALGSNVTALPPYRDLIRQTVAETDLLIGAVLLTGARAPVLVTRDMVKAMPRGSVIVDIAVDQGGCIETTRPTSYENPTYVEHGVIHFAVTNMPGAVPRTASQALSSALLPYVKRLAQFGPEDAALQSGINVQQGKIVHAGVAQALQQ